jgi:exodeoxyribonuclease VII small subunit
MKTDLNQSVPNNATPIDQMAYEQALSELERIVFALESNDQSLESALAAFERGQDLARHCAALLDQAELKVQQLSGDQLNVFESS